MIRLGREGKIFLMLFYSLMTILPAINRSTHVEWNIFEYAYLAISFAMPYVFMKGTEMMLDIIIALRVKQDKILLTNAFKYYNELTNNHE